MANDKLRWHAGALTDNESLPRVGSGKWGEKWAALSVRDWEGRGVVESSSRTGIGISSILYGGVETKALEWKRHWCRGGTPMRERWRMAGPADRQRFPLTLPSPGGRGEDGERSGGARGEDDGGGGGVGEMKPRSGICQRRTVPSRLAEAAKRPLRDRATLMTLSVWP